MPNPYHRTCSPLPPTRWSAGALFGGLCAGLLHQAPAIVLVMVHDAPEVSVVCGGTRGEGGVTGRNGHSGRERQSL